MRYSIPDGALSIIRKLKDNGYQAYLVGGCVRDLLMGREPHDWDICTSALPDQMKECFGRYKVIETGLKHGTLTVVLDDQAYEVTTFRMDGAYSDGRHPDNVIFTTNVNWDLARRDFTINAIAMSEEGEIYDPYGGWLDIQSRLIRCVGNPEERFREDALRIMRAARFSCTLGFDIAGKTKQAMIHYENRGRLADISAERIATELKKMLSGKQPGEVIRPLVSVLCVFWPEFEPCVGFDQRNIYHLYDVWNHTTVAMDAADTNDVIVRLALLLHDIGKPGCFTIDERGRGHFYGHPPVSAAMADDMLRRLKFDNKTRESVVQLIEYHDATLVPSEKHVRRWLNKIGEEQFRRLLSVKIGDARAHNPETSQHFINDVIETRKILEDVLKKEQCFSMKDLAIGGQEILSLGVRQGPEVGRILKELLDRVIEGDLDNDCELLIDEACKMTGG